MAENKINVLIGPIPWVGGVKRQTLDLVKFSKHNLKILKYSPLSLFYPRYLGSGFLVRKNLPLVDPYGFAITNFKYKKYDIVHTLGHPYWRDVYKTPRKSKTKYVHSVTQIYFEEDSSNKKNWAYQQNQNKLLIEHCRNVDVVVSKTRMYQKFLKMRYNIDSVYIPCGIDFDKFEKAKGDHFKKKFNIDEDFYLYIGYPSEVKRPNLFIELARNMPRRRFVMIGHDITHKILTKRYGKLPPNLTCLGVQLHDTVADAIAACRVFVLTSSRETFGTVIIEAMACKKTVVATNHMGPAELIDHNRTGILFDIDDFADLLEKAHQAWDRPELGFVAYNEAKEKYDWKHIAYLYDNMYEEIVRW